MYKEKAVRAIGEVILSVDISYEEETNTLIVKNVHDIQLTEAQQQTIKRVIVEAKDRYGYLLSEGYRFFFVEKFYETKFMKPDKGGLMGQRYFDLSDIEEYSEDLNCEQIAECLRDKYWNN